MKKLTIGIATYNDYDGLYFTITALKMYHPFVQTDAVEFVVLDNDPDGVTANAIKALMKNVNGKYVPIKHKTSTTVKWLIPEHASGEYILIIDSHVLLYPGAIDALMNYFDQCEDCKDLVQGPLLYDDFKSLSTSFKPGWGSHMYGKWHFDKELYEKGEPFEIPMNGMGLFAFKKSNFPVLNRDFRGFGCEEWYVHEKFRRNGGRVMCLPELKWLHRFKRPHGVPYTLTLEDKIWNYYIGWLELYDINHPMMQELYNYMSIQIKTKTLDRIKNEAIAYHQKIKKDHIKT